jgi:hypothetical protein
VSGPPRPTGEAWRAVSSDAPSITCPVCGRTSYHPTDVEEGWCGACHGATAHPTPPGLRWALLRGGSVDAGRLLAESLPDRYEVVLTGEVYVRADNGNGYSVAAYELEPA